MSILFFECVFFQFFLVGLLRVIGLCYLKSFDNIIAKCKAARDQLTASKQD